MASERLTVYGRSFGPEDLDALRQHESRVIREDLADFLTEWYAESPTVSVQSSGSTGAPKIFQVEKERMRASARMTCSFLGLKAGDSALLCMPLKYIGAKMLVVRALVWGLDLWCVKPSDHALRGLPAAPDFIAMTPAQVIFSLEAPEEAKLLRESKHLIIGGSAVEPGLAGILKDFPHGVWSTYAMTETLSHIALRRLSGPEASIWFRPFSGVDLRSGEDGALIIHAPAVHDGELFTNDLAEFNDKGEFRILGRKDNVINSGGVKIHIEQVESDLAPFMPCPFQISAVPDAHFGEVVVMLTTQEGDWHEAFSHLHPYSRPAHVFVVPETPRTGSGKPDRAAARALCRRLLEASPHDGNG